MSLEADLKTLLGALSGVSNRVYPDVASVGTTRPYITYQQVGGQAPWFIGKTLPSKRNAEMQVNVWATTRSQAVSLALAAESAMVASTAFDAEPIGAFVAEFDEDLGLYGTRQDFSCWSDR